MSGRTYGKTKDCKGCRYWSEMLAQSVGSKGLEAVCLSPHRGPAKPIKYVPSWHSCGHWKSGHHGAVDEPHPDGYGAGSMAAYAAEEGVE